MNAVPFTANGSPKREQRRPRSRLALALVLAAAPLAASAAPSIELRLGGLVQHAATLDAAALAALPQVTQSVSFLAGNTPQAHTYVGAGLYPLLDSAGFVVDTAVRNDLLNQYVVATGTDGYRSVFSLGELSPRFGNAGSIVAISETVDGTTRGLGADGFARVTAPGDLRGGRYVSNLSSLDVVRSASTVPSAGGGTSGLLRISGDVLRPGSFDLAALQTLTQRVVTAGANVFTGVSFWDLLDSTVGLALDTAVRNDVLGMYVVATGSDGYKSVFSLGELDPLFGNDPDLIAYSVDGQPLGSNGFARVVVPNDIQRGRYVSNLVSLEVFHAAVPIAPVPEPATVALLAVGLAAAAAVGRRRNVSSGGGGTSTDRRGAG